MCPYLRFFCVSNGTFTYCYIWNIRYSSRRLFFAKQSHRQEQYPANTRQLFEPYFAHTSTSKSRPTSQQTSPISRIFIAYFLFLSQYYSKHKIFCNGFNIVQACWFTKKWKSLTANLPFRHSMPTMPIREQMTAL